MATKSKPNELTITRVYKAPVHMVWDAWTDPKQTAQWWGPRGFTITTHSKDLRVGGTWNYTMHGPDGKDWPNVTKYHVVEKYSCLVYDHGGSADRPPLFRVTVNFSESKGLTSMEMTMAMETAEIANQTKQFVKDAGGNSTWDRLAEYLEKENSGKEIFVINRSFEAPIEKLFQMWIEHQHFSKWLPPEGFTMKFFNAEIKAGGETFYSMTSDDGAVTMYGKTKYIEIRKPDLLIYSQKFTDENGNLSRHPFALLWPESMLTTVTLTAEDTNQTRVTIEWEPSGNATREEVAAFVKERGGMTQGWTGSFDKLEDHLK